MTLRAGLAGLAAAALATFATFATLATLAALASAARAVESPDTAVEALAADQDYIAGRLALKAADWAQAVQRLQRAAVRQPDNADLHNDLGYAYRKLRQLDKAFEHYKRALTLDPRHRSAHEYIGEAYLMVGDVASAERHLGELRAICLLPCEELDDLRKAITAFKARAPAR